MMSADEFNLILLFLPIAAAIFAVWMFHPSSSELRAMWKRQFGLGLAGFALFAVLFVPFDRSFCGNMHAEHHAWTGLFSAAVVCFGTRPGRRRILSVIAMFILLVIAVQHYEGLVLSGEFIGTTDMESFDNHHEEAEYCSAEALWHTPVTLLYRLHCNRKEKSGIE